MHMFELDLLKRVFSDVSRDEKFCFDDDDNDSQVATTKI